jgi:hypothetical protein
MHVPLRRKKYPLSFALHVLICRPSRTFSPCKERSSPSILMKSPCQFCQDFDAPYHELSIVGITRHRRYFLQRQVIAAELEDSIQDTERIVDAEMGDGDDENTSSCELFLFILRSSSSNCAYRSEIMSYLSELIAIHSLIYHHTNCFLPKHKKTMETPNIR